MAGQTATANGLRATISKEDAEASINFIKKCLQRNRIQIVRKAKARALLKAK